MTGSITRGAIETGFFLAEMGLAAGGFDLRADEISTKGATLAVFRSTFLCCVAVGVDWVGLLGVAMCAVRTSMSHGMAVMLLGCV